MLKEVYEVLGQHELTTIDDGLMITRDNAWAFVNSLSEESSLLRPELVTKRDAEAASIGRFLLNPTIPFSWITNLIATKEVRDVGRILDELK